MSTQIIRADLVQLGAQAQEKTSAIKAAGQLLAKAGRIDPAYIDSLLRRETVANTFLGHGVAIPHGMIEDRHLIRETGIAILQVPEGVEWNPGQRVHLVIAIAAQSDEHIALLRRLTRLLQDESRLAQLFATSNPHDLIAALDDSAAAPAAPAAPATDLAHSASWQLNYPNGLHARPARAWSEQARRFAATVQVRNGNEVADAKNMISLLQLGAEHGHTLQLSTDGPDADAALQAMLTIANQLTAQEVADAQAAAKAAAKANRQHWQPSGKLLALRGITASPGLVIGQARVLKAQQIVVPDVPATLGYDGDLLETALTATRSELQGLADDTTRRLGKTEGGIFLAQAELLSDTDLITLTCQLMVEGHGVAWAWHEAVQRLADRLAALGNPLLAARAADLRDVGRRVLAKLAPDLALDAGKDAQRDNEVLIATDLAPSDTATLNPKQTLALVTAQGGPTSHTAILARTLDLPAVVAAGSAVMDIQDGTTLIVDGDSGTVYLNAGDDDLASARQWQQAQRDKLLQATREAQQPARTRDGQQVEVAANVNRPEQVAAALQAGAEGVGLMRTEFLFPGARQRTGRGRAIPDLPRHAGRAGRPPAGDPHAGYRRRQTGALPEPAARRKPLPRRARRAPAAAPPGPDAAATARAVPRRRPRPAVHHVPDGEHAGRSETAARPVRAGTRRAERAGGAAGHHGGSASRRHHGRPPGRTRGLLLGRHQRPHPVRIGHRPSAPGAGRRSRQPAPGGAAPDRANRSRRPRPRPLGRRVRRHGRRPAGRCHPHRSGRVRAVDEPA
ncbi:phosphotransferase system HPr (HPr) family protein [Vogesella perlucida]|nr:phosphotransferase system HPr (HPr) family protein [Vogesella perlucida]